MKKIICVLLSLILISGSIYFVRKPSSKKLDPDLVKVKEFCQLFYALENAFENEFGHYTGSIDSVFKEQTEKPPQKIGSYDLNLSSDGKEYHLVFYSEKNGMLFFNSLGKLESNRKIILDLAPEHQKNFNPNPISKKVDPIHTVGPTPLVTEAILTPALIVQEDTLGIVKIGNKKYQLLKKIGFVDKQSPYYQSKNPCFDSTDIGFTLLDSSGTEAFKLSEPALTIPCGLEDGLELGFYQIKDSVYDGFIFTADGFPGAPGNTNMNILKLSNDSIISITKGFLEVSHIQVDSIVNKIAVNQLHHHLFNIYLKLRYFEISIPFHINLNPKSDDSQYLTFNPTRFDSVKGGISFEINPSRYNDEYWNDTDYFYGINSKGKRIQLKSLKFKDVEVLSATIVIPKSIFKDYEKVIEFITQHENQFLIKILWKGKELWIKEADGPKIRLHQSG